MPISHPEARALYDSGAPVAHVAKALELSADAFRRLRQKHGWPMRPSPIVGRSAAPPPPAPQPEDVSPESADETPVNLPEVRRKVGDAAQSELAKVHRLLASGKTEDVERNARLLASLVKTLAELRRLEALDPLAGAPTQAAEGPDDQRPPRDLATLRDELARALERLSGEPAGPGADE